MPPTLDMHGLDNAQSRTTSAPPTAQHIRCDFVDTGCLVEELGLIDSHAWAPEGDGFADLSDLSDLTDSEDELPSGSVQTGTDSMQGLFKDKVELTKTRRSKNQRVRNQGRKRGRFDLHASSDQHLEVDHSVEAHAQANAQGSYVARSKVISLKPASPTLVGMGSGGSVSVFDHARRLVVYRETVISSTSTINECLLSAQQRLRSSGKPAFVKAGDKASRGPFDQYFFSLHRGSTRTPRMSASYKKNTDLAEELLQILEPVKRLVNATFRRKWPRLHQRYAAALDFIQQHVQGAKPLFGAFASFAINMDGVICDIHRDSQNFVTGICVVMPFGDFQPSAGACLVIEELGLSFEVAPGVAIYFPSALYNHYNTQLSQMGVRGSLVLWTGGTLIQWVDCGGRAKCEMPAEDRARYELSARDRLGEGLNLLYPDSLTVEY
ncbi:hypothetical protein PUNSTDRAFT_128348 [Punctularia strigosozonata HHB-11173 SS5]|uniref:Uncharacterized protein n=1 Tax=Punctularia strigosozonata (strain HHB-11173) TaxID=741275 RepID=R7S3V9_PUNST|nr:uncharacterized protein PUNSTDRAFT_128348 [Punctularia strigosozonata HHB-11173 SS5]EIN04544.1 hypothetical protein PUNSTDRAFT_128348 [Punctularia strigosozonata HHB-11173 SS5]